MVAVPFHFRNGEHSHASSKGSCMISVIILEQSRLAMNSNDFDSGQTSIRTSAHPFGVTAHMRSHDTVLMH